MSFKINYNFDKNFTKISPRKLNFLLIEEISNVEEVFPSESVPVSVEIKKLDTSWRDVFLVRFSNDFSFNPCDSVGIYAPNSDLLCRQFIDILRIQNKLVKITRKGMNQFDFSGFLFDFIKYKLDFRSLPKKAFLYEMAKYSKKKSQLEYLCSKEGTKDYLSLGTGFITLIDILRHFEVDPPLNMILENCDLIKPRYYTLINKTDIIIGLIKKEEDGDIRYGQVSDYINNLHQGKEGNKVGVIFRKNKLISDINYKNLVCFCTGAGIAPFYSFLFHKTKSQKISLVFGFRNETDNIFNYLKDEYSFSDIENVTFRLSSKKEYVYDSLDLIEKNKECFVFICGNKEVQRSIFTKILEKYPELVNRRRILFDSWA